MTRLLILVAFGVGGALAGSGLGFLLACELCRGRRRQLARIGAIVGVLLTLLCLAGTRAVDP